MALVGLGDALIIAGGGFVAGAVNAIAGGGSLVSFPALLGAGYPPLSANVTNTVSVLPGYLGGAIGYRRELAPQISSLRHLIPVSVIGSIAGTVVLLITPESLFEGLVPVLVLGASLLLAAQPRIQRWVSRQHEGAFARSPALLQIAVLLAAAYGAYFGGGLGVVLLAVLAIFVTEHLQDANALKTALTVLINLVAVVGFALFGPVRWVAVAIMAPMSLIGGWVGALLARRLSPQALRTSVAAFGVVIAFVLAI